MGGGADLGDGRAGLGGGGGDARTESWLAGAGPWQSCGGQAEEDVAEVSVCHTFPIARVVLQIRQ